MWRGKGRGKGGESFWNGGKGLALVHLNLIASTSNGMEPKPIPKLPGCCLHLNLIPFQGFDGIGMQHMRPTGVTRMSLPSLRLPCPRRPNQNTHLEVSTYISTNLKLTCLVDGPGRCSFIEQPRSIRKTGGFLEPTQVDTLKTNAWTNAWKWAQ